MKHSITGQESGASDAPIITPINGEYLTPFKLSPNDMLARHRAARDGEDTNKATPIMKRGNYFEDGARQWFEDEFGVELDHPQTGYRNEHCNLVASLDGFFKDDWEYENLPIPKGSVWELKLPRFPGSPTDSLERVIQVQAQLDCADANIGVIAELAQSDCKWRIAMVHRHEPTILAIREAVNIFWQHMEDGTDYPPITQSEYSSMIPGNRKPGIHDLTDGPSELIMNDARQDMIDAAETLVACNRTMAATKSMEESCKMRLKAAMGGVEKVLLPGSIKVFHSTVEYKAKPERTTVKKAEPARTGRRFQLIEPEGEGA